MNNVKFTKHRQQNMRSNERIVLIQFVIYLDIHIHELGQLVVLSAFCVISTPIYIVLGIHLTHSLHCSVVYVLLLFLDFHFLSATDSPSSLSILTSYFLAKYFTYALYSFTAFLDLIISDSIPSICLSVWVTGNRFVSH